MWTSHEIWRNQLRSNRLMATRGHCLCKRTSWEFGGHPSSSCYCHCDDCRRNCGAPVVAFLGVSSDHFSWTGSPPRSFVSSPGVRRFFCDTCGSPMGFEADHYPGSIYLYAASLENPQNFQPSFHLNIDHRLPWLTLDDQLAKHSGTLFKSKHEGCV